MGFRHAISDADGERVKPLLSGQPGRYVGVAEDNRRFLDAVLWIARTGAAWRDLPARLGHGNSQWRRFDRWAKARRFAGLAAARDLDALILDATAARAHPCATGSKRSGTGPAARASGRPAGVGAGSAPSGTAGSTASARPSR